MVQLQDVVLSADEFSRLLQISSDALDAQLAQRTACLAFGLETTARHDEYLPLDAVAVKLSQEMGNRIGHVRAAAVIRQRWRSVIELIQTAEFNADHMRTVLPPIRQTFIAVTVGDPLTGGQALPCVAFGTMPDILASMAGRNEHVIAISVQRAMHQVRTSAKRFHIRLPERFTVQRGDPGHLQWWRDIGVYRRLAMARHRTKKAEVKADHEAEA